MILRKHEYVASKSMLKKVPFNPAFYAIFSKMIAYSGFEAKVDGGSRYGIRAINARELLSCPPPW